MLAPIVLFVYNRPWHTQQAVEALQKCRLSADSNLYIFADGSKQNATEDETEKIAVVRKYIHSIDGFKSITIKEYNINKGLANSVIDGVTEIINEYGKVIVIEDDIVVHPFFLRFMNEALLYYKNENRIFSIGGFNYNFHIPKSYKKDIYIVHRAESWGWGTWANRWYNVDWNVTDAKTLFSNKRKQKKFNRGGNDMSPMLKAQMNGNIDSWAIRWDYHLYKHNAYCLRPVKTLVNNIGFDNSGTHCGNIDTSSYTAPSYQQNRYNISFVKKIKANRRISRAFHHFFDNPQEPVLYHMITIIPLKIIKKIKKYIYQIYSLVFVSNKSTIEPVNNKGTKWYGGNDYGGFAIDDKFMTPSVIVYSFGIGEDLSFDKDMIEKFGCHIYAYDPTPRAIQYVNNNNIGINFHFTPIGLSTHDGFETWYMPRNKKFVSCSVYNREYYKKKELVNNTIRVKVNKLDTILKANKHKRIDLLKLDIEGSEFDVLKNIINSHIDIHQITLEFHPNAVRNGFKKMESTIKELQKNDYKIIYYNPTDNSCTLLQVKDNERTPSGN